MTAVAKDTTGDAPSTILRDTRLARTTPVGPSRSSMLIRAVREDVLRTPARPHGSKTRRVSALLPNSSPPRRPEWMGDNQRGLMLDHSSARTRIRRRKSEASLSKEVAEHDEGGEALRDENTPPVS